MSCQLHVVVLSDLFRQQLKVLEPKEKQAYTLLQQVQTIKREKMKKRKAKHQERLKDHVRAAVLVVSCSS